jgi:hypothetical protein
MRYAWFQKHREAAMDETVKAQLEQVRTTALTNMFDVAAVIRIAEHLGLDELAAYLTAGNAGEYTRFILTGKT